MSEISSISLIVEQYPSPGASVPDEAVMTRLMEWARDVQFLSDTPEETNWRDFKRLYKKIELRLWPDAKRTRWNEEPPFLPISETEVELLGILMARVDSARQIGRGTPSPATLNYLYHRAKRLITHLVAHETSSQRQAYYVPLAIGLLRVAAMRVMPWYNRTFGPLHSLVCFGGDPERLRSARHYYFGSYRNQGSYEQMPLALYAPHLWKQRPELARRLCMECDVTDLAGSFSAVLGRHVLLNTGHEIPLLPLQKLTALLKIKHSGQQEWASADIPRAIEQERAQGTLSLEMLLNVLRAGYMEAALEEISVIIQRDQETIAPEVWQALHHCLLQHILNRR